MDFKQARRINTAKALDCCLDIVRSGRWASGCVSCPFKDVLKCRELMLLSAIDLLKEPEKVNVEILNTYWAECKECGEHYRMFMMPAKRARFCPNCGMELKYE